jgi:hypothetical protein
LTSANPPPLVRLSIGITGHRETNPAFATHRGPAESALTDVFARIDGYAVCEAETLGSFAPTRLHNLLASGIDQLAADAALRRGWELVAPLPLGRALNLAINALPDTAEDGAALLRGEAPVNPMVAARAQMIARSYEAARLFELAEQDARIERLFLGMLAAPGDIDRAQSFTAHCSERVAIAGRVMVEQSDIVVAVWDGVTRSHVGGTGHTIVAALERGTPVVWIDPARADDWRILVTPESLAAPDHGTEDRDELLARLVRAALRPGEGGALRAGAEALGAEAWHPRSSRLWTGYRRIEALFGGGGRPFRSLEQVYERPEEIASGTSAPYLAAAYALVATDPDFVDRIEVEVLRRFAWADGISARLSDYYRGGMIGNFITAAMAVGAGLAYLPLEREGEKWAFALVEFLLLWAILLVIWLAGRWHWHKRWFETRRVAEYLRHAPILLLLGVARPPGRWPKGTDTSWPEYYARHGLRAPGLPCVTITSAYLREALGGMLDVHVVRQRDYHIGKALRLTRVHERLDGLARRLFQLAVLSVTTYLLLVLAADLGGVPQIWPHSVAKILTYLAVMFPTLGASIAGMRYFGDFERFAAISDVTAGKLDNVHRRIQILLSAPDEQLDYGEVSELAHTTDDIVVAEIENWQAVFGGKHISVPV